MSTQSKNRKKFALGIFDEMSKQFCVVAFGGEKWEMMALTKILAIKKCFFNLLNSNRELLEPGNSACFVVLEKEEEITSFFCAISGPRVDVTKEGESGKRYRRKIIVEEFKKSKYNDPWEEDTFLEFQKLVGSK